MRPAVERCACLLAEEFGVRCVYLFGSAAAGRLHARSDIDLAVVGLPPGQYFRALSRLWGLLPAGMSLDLVPWEDAQPTLRQRVLKEGILLYGADLSEPHSGRRAFRSGWEARNVGDGQTMEPMERSAVLRQEIEDELANLDRLEEDLAAWLARARQPPESLELRIAGSILHDFYTCCERTFRRIAAAEGLPEGPDWHAQLLDRMAAPAPGIRPAVIDEALHDRLQEYLRFRHAFRNVYGFALRWARMEPLVNALPVSVAAARYALQQFLGRPSG